MKKRILSLVLTLCICIGLLPTAALAEDSDFLIENGVLLYYKGSGGDVVIPNGVITIGEGAFGSHGKNVKSITIPDSVVAIKKDAFFGCANLERVTIPNGLVYIGSSAFYGCSSLNQVTIPASVRYIDSAAFYDCASLSQITLPDSAAFSGNAFYGTALPEEEYVGQGISISENDRTKDGYWITSEGRLYDYDGPGGAISIPNGVVSIRSLARSPGTERTDITSIEIPNSVKTIGSSAFRGCSALKALSIPDSVIVIEDLAFAGCTALESVTIGNSVVFLDRNTFGGMTYTMAYPDPETGELTEEKTVYEGCTNLRKVTFPTADKIVPSLKLIEIYDVFGNCPTLEEIVNCTTKADLELAVDIDFGGDLAASLGAFGLDIMDVGAKVGGNLSASASVEGKCEEDVKDGTTTLNYQESIHTKADLYAPIVTLYAGSSGTLLGDIGVGGCWEIVGKDKGASCFPLVNNDWVFWNKTVTLDENGEIIAERADMSPEEQIYAALQSGDFSVFAGTYAPYCTYEYGTASNLELKKNGAIMGETGSFGSSYPLFKSGTAPLSVTQKDDGSYKCILDQDYPYRDEGDDDDELRLITYGSYEIYLPGVPLVYHSGLYTGPNYEDKVRIRYLDISGGVAETLYYKLDSAALSNPADAKAAAGINELWTTLEGTWTFEEYLYRGTATHSGDGDHTMEFRYVDNMPCISKYTQRTDSYFPDKVFHDFSAIDEFHYNAYTYKRGSYGGEGANWGDDVRLVWWSFDLSNLSNGELVITYNIADDNFLDNYNTFKYSRP